MTGNCYKPSIYNLLTDNFNGELLILNTYSGTLARIHNDNRDSISKYLSQEKIAEDETPQFQSLKENGFIVNYGSDEKELVDHEYYKMIYSNDMLELIILPTDACNFNCAYCYQHEPYHFMSKETEETIIKFIDRNVKNYKKLYVSWFGGEPLLAKETVIRIMDSIVSICKRDGVVLMSRITSNGYELDLDTFEKLVANKVLFYEITLDGPAEIHDTQRPLKSGKGTFEKIVNNFRAIRDHAASKRFQINIRVNISKKILPRMDEFINFVNGEFGDDKRFVMMWEMVQDWGGTKVQDMQDELLEGPEAYFSWIDEATRKKLNSTEYVPFKKAAVKCETCKNNGFVVNYDGTIHKCTLALYDENEKIRDINKIGFIDSNGKLNLDDSRSAKWVVRRELKETCKTCVYYPLCMGVGCTYSYKIKQEDSCGRQIYTELLKRRMRSKDMNGVSIQI